MLYIGWFERGIWKEPNPKTIQDVFDWFEKQNMIILGHGSGNRQFTLITIVNWKLYKGEHDSKETSSDDAGNSEELENNQLLDINNNDKNANNEKETKEEKENIHTSQKNGEDHAVERSKADKIQKNVKF